MDRILNLTLILLISYSNSASITTYSSLLSTNHSSELISNSSYRYLFLRQYYIDLLNISHSSLIQSMIKTHHFLPELEQIKSRRRRQISFNPPHSTIHSTNCVGINPHRIQTTFQWNASFSSIELIYHLDANTSSIPIELSIIHSQTFTIRTNLNYDSNRNYHSINLTDYFLRLNMDRNILLQIILSNQTCPNSHGYIVLSSRRISPKDSPSNHHCRVKSMEINFEELGLADLIIRPKEYTFTYCDGSCENVHHQGEQSSFRIFLQSILSQKHSNIPRLNCQPSEYSNDHFLLRQPDGNMAISPIKNAIVKQCACL